MRIACKLCLSALFLLCFLMRSGAQNLVQNPSFENVNANCSGFTGAGYINLYNWYNPDPTDTCSTPDWFATCLSTLFPTHAPNSQLGNQNPRTGQAYAGFISYDASSSGYREYVEGELSTPLTAGVSYCVTFYVSLADNSPYAINKIGMYLSNSLTQFTVSHCVSTVPLPYTPQLQWAGTPITDKVNWVKLQWQYVATGGEKYFTIGNFFNNAGTTVSNVGGGSLTTPFAYYFIDDVSIMPGPCCNNDITPVGPVCASAPAFTLTPDTPGGTWSGAGITNSATGMFDPATAGTGTHVVTYSLACGAGTTAIVVNPCALTVCKDGSNNLTVSGGTGPYNWQSMTTYTDCSGCPGGNCIPFLCTGSVVTTWSTTTANTPSITAPGSLPIRVIDNAGNSFTVTSLSALSNCTTSACPTLTTAVASQTNVNCFGASTGSASVSASGGTGPYTYTWTPGNLLGASQAGLTAGAYTIAVKDANGCPGTKTLTITQPASALSVAVSGTTSATCGQSNGSAMVTASGGTAGYTYSWSPSGGTGASASGLAAGSYTAQITDSKGCTASVATLIGNTGGPALTVSSQTNVSCFGGSNGAAIVSATGGTGPYTYTWSPGNLSGTSQSSLGAGTYTISVKDAGNCTGSTTVTITQPATAVNAAITGTAPAACGQSNGSATVTANGGTAGYTYSWSPSGGTAASASGLAAGNYTAYVTDSKGCSASAITLISSTGGPTLTVSSQTNVSCFGGSNGAAAISPAGGTGPYTYTWSPGGLSGASQSGLAAGTYTVSVKDAGNCIGSTTVTITQPAAVNATITATAPTTCGQSVGGATVTASGGTPAYTYSWSPSGGTAAAANGLAAGNYSVTVTDSKGCSQTASALINSTGGPTVTVSSQTNIACFGGSTGAAAVSATGGSGTYTYTWSPSGGSTASASGLVAGTYTVTVSDGSCPGFAVVTLTQSPAINAAVSTTAANCAASDGSASVSASGGTGTLSYLWSTGSATTTSISNLAPGAYTVTVTDSKGCTQTATGLVTVNNGGFAVDAGTSTTIETGGNTVLHGTGPSGATYSWTPSSSLSCSNCQNPTASPDVTTTYTLIVTNSSGCSSADTVTVIVRRPCGELFVPTAFSPNNDGQNDVLFVMGNCITDLEFAIFDRWGEKVFGSSDPTLGWDGTFNGKKMDPAVFAYYLNATVDGERVNVHGSITLVK